MTGPDKINEHLNVIDKSPEKSITIDGRNGTVGHIAAELGINMKWLDAILGNYSNRPKTYVTKNFTTPGKGEGSYEERYWTSPRQGETYSFRMNEDSSTGGTLIRTRGNETISLHVPPEAIREKPISVEKVKQNTRAALEDLLQDIQTA